MFVREKLENRIDALLARVQSVYADLAARSIERKCTLQTTCCHFNLTGCIPYLTKGEAFVAAKALRASGRTKLPERSDGACPLLHPQTNRCLIYENRPFGCRTHFCQAAGGPYTRKEVLNLIQELENIDSELGGCGAQKLSVAMREALKEF